MEQEKIHIALKLLRCGGQATRFPNFPEWELRNLSAEFF